MLLLLVDDKNIIKEIKFYRLFKGNLEQRKKWIGEGIRNHKSLPLNTLQVLDFFKDRRSRTKVIKSNVDV